MTPAVNAVKSTVPVGTAPRIAELLQSMAPARDPIEVAWNPEFLPESFAVEDTLRPDRLVLGFNTLHSWAESILRQAFAKIIVAGTPTLVTDWATAELADILGYDHRIGRHGMRPGLGFGGGCLPKDLGGFITRADELDAAEAVGMLR